MKCWVEHSSHVFVKIYCSYNELHSIEVPLKGAYLRNRRGWPVQVHIAVDGSFSFAYIKPEQKHVLLDSL